MKVIKNLFNIEDTYSNLGSFKHLILFCHVRPKCNAHDGTSKNLYLELLRRIFLNNTALQTCHKLNFFKSSGLKQVYILHINRHARVNREIT